MNDFFSNIPLNDASEQLILQTNGICAHACILAWFQTIISAALYSLFNVYTLEKAQKRLVALNHAKRNEDLSQLETAAQKTVINAQTQLQQHYENKSKYLQNLNNELAKNRKKSQQIVDHPEYISKKIKKLSDFEKEQLERIKSLTDAPKASIFSIFTGNKSKDEQSPRLRKAILAKKIYEHQNFLEHTKSTLQSPQGANF